MTMTPEERAVVQAAIRMHAIGREPTGPEQSELRRLTHQLIFICPECNAGGHTCPGDGNSIGHGDRDCGEHDDDGPENELAADRRHRFQGHEGSPCLAGWSEGNACDRPEGDRVHIEEAGEDDPQWVTRTWADVRPGDRVRLPGTEHVAEVESAIGIGHVMHPNGRSAAGWREIKVRLAGRDGLLPMNPAGPIEIELTPSELAAIEGLGWSNRMRLERA